MSQFDNQVALVTGAGGGIGLAIVDKLSSRGADIALADMSAQALQKAIALVHANDRKAVSFVGDLGDRDYCDKLPAQVIAELGKLDILVNNAGLMRRGAITDTSDEDFQLSLAINVEAPFRLCRAAIPIMAQAGAGKIVNLASCWGVYPGPNHLIYCTSKAALASMTRCLGRDHAHQNIHVNAVCPNEVNTPMLRTGFAIRGLDPDNALNDLNATVPLGRIAEPEDIADVVAFLASNEARYLCGALIEVNGGKPVY